MAVTQIHAIETTLVKAIDYISNADKTDEKLLISGFNCTPEMAAYEFEFTKRANDKQGGKLAYHLIQSFKPGEVEHAAAHEIGKQLAALHLKGEYEYIIATHTDKGHIHNHIIFNSVPMSGKNKYRSTMPSYYKIREFSDRLCHQHGLSVVEPSGHKGMSYKEHLENKKGTSWKSALREAVDNCIVKAKDWDEFILLMQAEEIEIKQGKHIAFRAAGQKRFTRSKMLGVRYTEANIKSQLSCEVKTIKTTPAALAPAVKTERKNISLLINIENSIKAKRSAGYARWAKSHNLKMAAMTMNYLADNNLLVYDNLSAKHDELKNNRDTALSRIKEVESRIKDLNAVIKDLDTFRKNKPIVEKLDKVVFKDKYKRENETVFILFNAAKQSLKTHYPNGKYPLIKDLRAAVSELYTEKNKLYPEYYQAKDELKTLSTYKSNVDSILGHDEREAREMERTERNKNKNKDILE